MCLTFSRCGVERAEKVRARGKPITVYKVVQPGRLRNGVCSCYHPPVVRTTRYVIGRRTFAKLKLTGCSTNRGTNATHESHASKMERVKIMGLANGDAVGSVTRGVLHCYTTLRAARKSGWCWKYGVILKCEVEAEDVVVFSYGKAKVGTEVGVLKLRPVEVLPCERERKKKGVA